MATPVHDTAGALVVGTDGNNLSSPQSFTIPALAVGASLVVTLHWGAVSLDVSGVTVTATYNGVSMSSAIPAVSPGSNTTRSQMFTLLNCGDGASHSLVVTLSTGSVHHLICDYYSATGVSGFSGGTSTTGLSGNSPTLAVTSSTNSLVLADGSHGDIISGTLLSGTQRWLNNFFQSTAGSDVVGATYTGAASVNTQFSSGVSDHWTMLGISIDGATGAVPDAPVLIMATGGDTRIYLDWTVPADNGAAITDYTVQTSANGTTGWTTVTAAASTVDERLLTGQTNGTTQYFRVAAVNSVGTGAWSNVLSATPASFGTALLESEGLVTRNDEAGGNRNLEATAASGGATASPAVLAASVTMPTPTKSGGGKSQPAVSALTVTMPTPSTGSGGVAAPAVISRAIKIYSGGLLPGTLAKGVGSISRTNTNRDLSAVGASWYYDWASYSTTSLGSVPSTPGIEYVPMMWGDWINDPRWGSATGDGSLGGNSITSLGPANTLLGFNEPDGVDQANMTVARALQLWPDLEATGARLGSPAPGSGGMSWLASFMAGSGGYVPKVDFICVHWYVQFNHGFANIADFLDDVHATYPTKPIWLTEVGDLSNGQAANASLMSTVMTALSTRPWVERVAWYVLQDVGASNQLVDGTGTPTTSGTTWNTYAPGTPATPGLVVKTGSSPTPAVLAASVTAPAPTPGGGATKTTAVALTSVSMPTPSFQTTVSTNPAVLQAVVTMPTPTLSGGGKSSPAVALFAVTMPTPTPGGGATKSVPAALSAVVTMPQASPGSGSVTTPAVLQAVVTMPTPSLSAGSSALPNVMLLTDFPLASSARAGSTASPVPALFAVTMQTPTASAAAVPTPAPAALVVTMPQATPRSGSTPATAVLQAVVTMPQATPGGGASMQTTPALFAVTMPSPLAGSGAVITPAVLQAVVTSPAVTKAAGSTAAPAVALTVVTMPTPTPRYGGTASPAVALLVVTVPAATGIGGAAGTTFPSPIQAVVTAPAVSRSASGSAAPSVMPLSVTAPLVTAGGHATSAVSPILTAVTMPQAVGTGSRTIAPSFIVTGVTMPTVTITGGGTAVPASMLLAVNIYRPFIGRAGVLNDADFLFLGDQRIIAVYVGSTYIWPPLG